MFEMPNIKLVPDNLSQIVKDVQLPPQPGVDNSPDRVYAQDLIPQEQSFKPSAQTYQKVFDPSEQARAYFPTAASEVLQPMPATTGAGNPVVIQQPFPIGKLLIAGALIFLSYKYFKKGHS